MSRRVFTYRIPGTNIGISLQRLREKVTRMNDLASRYSHDRPFANSLLYGVELLEKFLVAVEGKNSPEIRQTWNRYAQHHNDTLSRMARVRLLTL